MPEHLVSPDRPKKQVGLRRIVLAFMNSMRGFAVLINREAAFQQELILLPLAVAGCFLLKFDLLWCGLILGSHFVILITEVLNTGLEEVADRITLEHDPMIRNIKDFGSAAVFLSLLNTVMWWGLALASLWEKGA